MEEEIGTFLIIVQTVLIVEKILCVLRAQIHCRFREIAALLRRAATFSLNRQCIILRS